jgi:spoIIIJ-associated protein
VEWVEASGKSLHEAKETVLDLLGVAEDDAEFVVLSEPKAGLFGRLRGEARVKARVRPVTPPPKRARRQRSDRSRGGGQRSRSDRGGRSNGSGETSQGGGRSGGASAGDRTKGAGANGQQTTTSGEGAERNGSGSGANGTTSAGGSRRRRRGRGGGGGSSNGERQKQQTTQRSGTDVGEGEDTMEESLTLEQQGEAARGFVAGLVEQFGLDAEVSVEQVDDDTVQVSASGEDLGLLVGPRGATLAAVQDLTRTFVQRQSESRTDRILVDVGGYREKRAAALRRFTLGIVEEVRGSGEERALEPMSPADRKVIHDTVNEIDGVETRSDGVEPSRYVVIQPAG